VILYLLHGLGGSPADWRDLKFQAEHRLWTLSPEKNFSDCARELAIASEQEKAPVVLAGYSLGGRIALAASELMGSNLRGLILISAGFGHPSEKEQEIRRLADAEWATLAEQNPPAFWQKWYQQDLFASFQELPEGAKEGWIQRRKSVPPPSIAHHFRSLGQGNHPFLLPTAKNLLQRGVPILYLAGEKDKKYAALAKEMAMIGATSKIAPNAGHILPLEAADFLVKEGNEFLKRIELEEREAHGQKHRS
jgi:2-succinyl-6-hydroxy-2,4-cyclohexadiene-1-carboxylate synthase